MKVKEKSDHQQRLLLLNGQSVAAENAEVKRVGRVRRVGNVNSDGDFVVIVEIKAERPSEGFGMGVPVVGRHHE